MIASFPGHPPPRPWRPPSSACSVLRKGLIPRMEGELSSLGRATEWPQLTAIDGARAAREGRPHPTFARTRAHGPTFPIVRAWAGESTRIRIAS